MIRYNVANFLAKLVGSREEFSFSEKLEFDWESQLVPAREITGTVSLIKLPHEVNVQINDLFAALSTTCIRCLAPFDHEMEVPLAQREFIIDLEERSLMVGEDVLYVNVERNEIVLDEMIRQELLLHFPASPVCSESCKGLCTRCGTNKNKETCSCDPNAGEHRIVLSIT